jgi:hypothetical protein
MSTLITSKRLHLTLRAYRNMIDARDDLKAAGAVCALRRVRQAIKSVQGAVRHATRLEFIGDEDRAKMRRRRR